MLWDTDSVNQVHPAPYTHEPKKGASLLLLFLSTSLSLCPSILGEKDGLSLSSYGSKRPCYDQQALGNERPPPTNRGTTNAIPIPRDR
ncbi:hypothetical protein BCR42DRAFT_420952, partial [Absidia repens]